MHTYNTLPIDAQVASTAIHESRCSVRFFGGLGECSFITSYVWAGNPSWCLWQVRIRSQAFSLHCQWVQSAQPVSNQTPSDIQPLWNFQINNLFRSSLRREPLGRMGPSTGCEQCKADAHRFGWWTTWLCVRVDILPGDVSLSYYSSSVLNGDLITGESTLDWSSVALP